jgi:hypothetical protein
VFEPYAKLHGGAYYELINGRVLHNRAYRNVPEIRVTYPVEVPDHGLVKRKPMYELIEEPYLLEFSTAPERHTALFQDSIDNVRAARVIETCGVRSSPSPRFCV